MGGWRRQRSHVGFVACIVCIILRMTSFSAANGEAANTAEADLIEGILASIRDCMSRSPAPWPQAWQQEYIDTIRQAIPPHWDDPQMTRRLQILRDGFSLYWDGITNHRERSRFEVRLAEIRWYAEHLMKAELPREEDRRRLRDQQRDLVGYAAQSLLSQFPFLDPNIVREAQADCLAECYRNIEAPLLPIFVRPFSEAQLEQTKQQWHSLRYARVSLWQRLAGKNEAVSALSQRRPSKEHPHYLLTQRSLGQLQAQFWAFMPPSPDYYSVAVANELSSQRQRAQLLSAARNEGMRLSLAGLQTEHLAFLLAALLETPCGPHSAGSQKQPAEPRESTFPRR